MQDDASLSEGRGNAVKGADMEERAKVADELHSFVWKGTIRSTVLPVIFCPLFIHLIMIVSI